VEEMGVDEEEAEEEEVRCLKAWRRHRLACQVGIASAHEAEATKLQK